MGMGGKTHAFEMAHKNNMNRLYGKFGKLDPVAIVRRLRADVAASNIEPGDRRAFINLKLTTTASSIAVGAMGAGFNAE